MADGAVDDIALSGVQGFLSAFAALSSVNNLVGLHWVARIGAGPDVELRLHECFARIGRAVDGGWRFRLIPVDDWRTAIVAAARRNLFLFTSGREGLFWPDDRWEVQLRALGDRLGVDQVLDVFVELLAAVLGDGPTPAWQVRLDAGTAPFADLWEAYVFQVGNKLILLWFGSSD